jgi:hypothetical protein
MTGKRDFEPAAEALPANRKQDAAPATRPYAGSSDAYRASIAVHCPWQVLLDAGAEAEMRTLGIEQRRTELTIAEMVQRGVERRNHSGVD